MIKKITFSLLLISTISFAQNLKVKKDLILLDANPIAKITNEKGVYTFQNLDGTPIYKMNIVYSKLDEETRDNYILLKDANNLERKVELNYEVSSAFANDEKIVVQNSFNKYGILNSNGINKAKLEEFLNNTDYKRELSPEKIAIIEANKRVKEFNPFVNSNGEVLKGGNNGTKVGYIKGVKTPFSGMSYMISDKNSENLTFYNLNNQKVAEFNSNSFKVTTVNGSSYTFNKGQGGMTPNFVSLGQVLSRIIKLDENFGK
ncbi:hypothetical protein CMU85_10160 [Elizabethkingia anophelis]|uniref:hypothetical protein n=1 Tax=Elizabethkingia anophelis TaxID=1117645 RepID=UPI0021A6A070|nr:hypothetical protein [Elizabethkingia anophelis]MCT4199364.1 hypothetical protein [Elizabethkingia anophelis]MCT4227549.1 hypothetical protein [Elizabethkingia anophelis]MCT4309738.1 hypothetical protein [Elizabethkingia anophelis]MDV3581874.1 hypothetical protein [Elizabethkingia anophelis]